MEIVPAMLWLGFGVILGLGLAVYLLVAGVLPGRVSTAQQVPPDTTESVETSELAAEESELEEPRTNYEFYEVLPELEVVVPESEVRSRADSPSDAPDQQDEYMLQAGSFRDSEDAEARKAQLAFLGMVADVTTVSVNGELWHRVQVGPYTSARALDQAQRQLRDNGIQALATKPAR